MIPASIKSLTRTRPFIPGATVSAFPLRCFDGRTWAERKRDAATPAFPRVENVR
jgi:hypothetical protein